MNPPRIYFSNTLSYYKLICKIIPVQTHVLNVCYVENTVLGGTG